MNLNSVVVPAVEQLSGSDSGLVATAGQSIKIETTPGGEDILDVTVPEGETWTFSIAVDIRVS